MNEPAWDLSVNDRAVTVDGMEALFTDSHQTATTCHQAVIDSEVTVSERVPLVEAMAILQMSESTIRRRIRSGKLQAVKDDDGRVFVLCPSETVTARRQTATTCHQPVTETVIMRTDSQQTVTAAVTLTRAEYDALCGRVQYLQGQVDVYEQNFSKLLVDRQSKQTWWHRFASWAMGKPSGG